MRKKNGKKNRDKKILQKIRKTKSETREKQERGGVVVVCCSSKADEKPAQTTMTTTTNQTNRSRREERRERKERERGRGQCMLHSISRTSTKGKQNVMSSVTQHLERPLIGTQNVMSGVISDSRLERPLSFC